MTSTLQRRDALLNAQAVNQLLFELARVTGLPRPQLLEKAKHLARTSTRSLIQVLQDLYWEELRR